MLGRGPHVCMVPPIDARCSSPPLPRVRKDSDRTQEMEASPTGGLQALRNLGEQPVESGAYLGWCFFTKRDADVEMQLVAGTRRKQIGNEIGEVLYLRAFKHGASTNRLGRCRRRLPAGRGPRQPQVSGVVVSAAYRAAVLGHFQPAALYTGSDALAHEPPRWCQGLGWCVVVIERDSNGKRHLVFDPLPVGLVDETQILQVTHNGGAAHLQSLSHHGHSFPGSQWHGQSRYGALYERNRHQQHRRECIGAPLDVARCPGATGDCKSAAGLSIEQQVAELVRQRESTSCGVRIRNVARVDHYPGPMLRSCDGNPSNPVIRQLQLLDRDAQCLDQPVDIDEFVLHECPIEVLVQLLGQLISLRPCGVQGLFDWRGMANRSDCLRIALRVSRDRPSSGQASIHPAL